MCEERLFEVVSAEPGPAGGVRYVLEPWPDHHIIRVSEAYDEGSEQRREIEFRSATAREKGRKAANFAGIFTGLLPATVQEQLASELGILPTKLSSLSLVLPFILLVWAANDVARRALSHGAPMSLFLMMVAAYLLIESAIRLNIIWFIRRPIGSILGWLPYLLYYVMAGKRSGAASPFVEERGEKLFFTELSEDVALRDAYTMREPLLTLLTPAEQAALAQRFGYDYRKQSSFIAAVVLVMSLAGVVGAFVSLRHGVRFGALLSLVVALVLGGEQVLRLGALRRGPAGSILGVLVRPLTRKLLR